MLDWVESISSQKQINFTPTLPNTVLSYGSYMVIDNMPPTVVRQFVAENVTRQELEAFITQAAARNRTFKITTSLGVEYTGRYIGFSAQQTRGADDYTLSLTLQDLTSEDTNSPRAQYTLT